MRSLKLGTTSEEPCLIFFFPLYLWCLLSYGRWSTNIQSMNTCTGKDLLYLGPFTLQGWHQYPVKQEGRPLLILRLNCLGCVALPSELIVYNDVKDSGWGHVEAQCWEDYGECSVVPALNFIFQRQCLNPYMKASCPCAAEPGT